MTKHAFLVAFESHKELIDSLGRDKAFLVWTMGLYLQKTDLLELASESLTDASNDKKIDFIHIDSDGKKIVMAQGYYSSRQRASAPGNKASDLNTACAWLATGSVKSIPEKLRTIISNCRDAIDQGEVDAIELLYVHNLPESINVQRELDTAKEHLERIFSSPEGDDSGLRVIARELGVQQINKLYVNKETDIVIHDKISISVTDAFMEKGDRWESTVFSIPGDELKNLYVKYENDLFSANYRSFLGVTRQKKINTEIKATAEQAQRDFWVYNNGITILTKKITKKDGKITLDGISIINGAQTTGSIGSTDSKADLSDVHVLCRAVCSTDKETIDKIVLYNNTQNEIKSWDRYSNNETQIRLKKEFETLGHKYSIKRGDDSADYDLSIEGVMQPLLAWLGDYSDADKGKNTIFNRKELYEKAFRTNAQHILFVYSLSRCIDEIRLTLKQKDDKTQTDEKLIRLLRHFKFKPFLIAVIGKTFEDFVGKSIPDSSHVSFCYEASKHDVNTMVSLSAMWMPIVEMLLNGVSGRIGNDFSDYRLKPDAFEECCNAIRTLTPVIRDMGNAKITNFINLISC